MELEAFLTENRDEIIERCRAKVAGRRAPTVANELSARGIPLFLDQLIDTLHLNLEQNPDRAGVATQHGNDLMSEGFTVAQVVHGYGDVCQSVTSLAVEHDETISPEEFKVLNRCLDDAIADAVTEFARMHDRGIDDDNNTRLGIFAHEVRNLLTTATLAFDILKSGNVGIAGSTGLVLERVLTRLGSLVDRSLTDVRLVAGHLRSEHIELRRFLSDIEAASTMFAKSRGITVTVELPAGELAVEGDPQILSAVVINLVQNAVKFSRADGHVTLSARATAERVEIDVADTCGGLPPGTAEVLFRPFQQRSTDRSGVGLGLIVARRGAEAHGGTVRVRDIPGTGCVFTVDLPRVPNLD